MKEVEIKERKLAALPDSNPEALDAFLRTKPIPAVLGPEFKLYILDRHHLGLALLKRRVVSAYVKIHSDWSHLSRPEFLSRMEAEGLLYLNDENGVRKEAVLLPTSLWEMPDAPYRSFAYDVRKAGGYAKTKSLYSGWHWADFFRTRISLADRDYEEAVHCGVRLALSADASHLPGYLPTAANH